MRGFVTCCLFPLLLSALATPPQNQSMLPRGLRGRMTSAAPGSRGRRAAAKMIAGATGDQSLFVNRLRFSTGSANNPAVVVTGDFNGDGIPDLATLSGECPIATDCSQQAVSVFIGKGDGTFATHVDYAVGPLPDDLSLVTGDFNGDGKQDLALAVIQCPNFCEGVIAVLLGNGDGTFQSPVNSSAGSSSPPFAIAVGDFNGDGKLDLAVTQCPNGTDCANGSVGVMLGKGDGTFQAVVEYQVGRVPGPVAVGDFNGDGKPDLLVAECNDSACSSGFVDVLVGNGDGTFQAAVQSSGGGVDSVATGDFNSDGKLDLVVTQCGVPISYMGFPGQCVPGSLGVLLGNGDGTFQAEVSYGNGNFGTNGPVAVSVGDVNGDGKLDFVEADEVQGTASVFLGDGTGNFRFAGSYGIGGTAALSTFEFNSPVSMLLADLDRDGRLDLVTTNYWDSTVNVAFGDGSGAFQTYRDYGVVLVDQFLTGPLGVQTGDFNGDGKLDLAVPDCLMYDNFGEPICTQGGVHLLLGNGDGTFKTPLDSAAGTNNPVSITVGDFDGDGRLDVAVAEDCNNSPGPCFTGTMDIVLGNGDGTFSQKSEYATALNFGPIVVGDYNGDGKLDLVTQSTIQTRSAYVNQLVMFLGKGDGTFQAPTVLASSDSSFQVAAQADLNGDGKADLILTTCATPCTHQAVGILLGNGDGTFQKEVDYETAAEGMVGSVVVADFNQDGKPDLAVGFYTSGACTGSQGGTCGFDILLGNGDGSFQAPVHHVTLYGPWSVAAADFNGDGNLDLAATMIGASPDNEADPVVSVFLGNGDGTFQTAQGYGIGYRPTYMAVGDFNGDGRPDLAVEDNGLSILQNTVPGVFQDFSVSASAPKPASIAPGDSATSTVTVGSLTGFNSSVSLQCSVSPASSGAPTCSLDPASVTPAANGTATAKLTIDAGSSASLLHPALPRESRPRFALWLPIAGLALVGMARRQSGKKRSLGVLTGILLAGGLAVQVACGGGGNSGGGSGGSSTQTFIVTVSGTSGSIVHKTITTISVQ